MNDSINGCYPVVIVGGGQAGLAMSWELQQKNIDHIIFERDELVHDWKDNRWDSFTLVTPNWQCRLPGFSYDGDDPNGFMTKEETYQWLQRYITGNVFPVREHMSVTKVQLNTVGGFDVVTSAGSVCAENVVVATGGYHEPVIPRCAERLPASIVQLTAASYRNPEDLPDGSVLVVGNGQSGAQIAEDLLLAGKTVHLATSSAPRVARFYRGRDCIAWLNDMGVYDVPITEHPGGLGKRENTNHYVTGRDGGHDIDLRDFALRGMKLYGRLEDIVGTTLYFTSDLAANLDHADAVMESIKDDIDRYIADHGIVAPQEPRYQPCWQPVSDANTCDYVQENITAIIWCTGFRTDYRWLQVGVFDGEGHPCHNRGVTHTPGLFFLGLPWLHTWGSGRFASVADDAHYLAQCIAARVSSSIV